ncbi:MAG TPA: FAD-dependent monooxygenase [Phycisphaerae bacterium]|nr:FAD-dependent monooxygenase [Phycisphaerae bacterium]
MVKPEPVELEGRRDRGTGGSSRGGDIVIVGAGPGGCAAALRLARLGHRVELFEQARFPRNKVCGGCLSGDAVEELETLLVPGRGFIFSLPGTPVQSIEFIIGSRRIRTSPRNRCRIIPRDLLDSTLADAASAAGTRLRFGEKARLITSDDGMSRIEISDRVVTPRWILWAAGLAHVPASFKHRSRKSSAMVGQAWSIRPNAVCPPMGHIALHWLHGGYVGLATVDTDRCLIALAARTTSLAGQKPWDALKNLNPRSPLLEPVALIPPSGALAISSFPYRPRSLGRGNLLMIGDAAGFEEPFSGEGIGQALRSAREAVDAILNENSYDAAQRHYATAMAAHRRIRRRTRWLAAALRSPVANLVLNRAIGPAPWLDRLLNHVHVKGTA